MTRTLEVVAPGLLSTLQDLGRDGWRHLGVARAGALDPDAARLGNRLVGNAPDAAVLELTLQGPTLRFDAPVRIALIGRSTVARFDGIALPMGRPIDLPAGTLSLGAIRDGARAWLAVDGGFAAAPVLGSRSTDLRGGFGGHEGRALRAGDRLALVPGSMFVTQTPRIPGWWAEPEFGEHPDAPVRYLPSNDAAATALASQAWQVSAASNRQGLRLHGAPLTSARAGGLSEPVAPGTLQLPPDGQPIVLLADAQTVGGYPRLGHVIAADLPRLAQLPPHATLRFQACTAAQAQAAAAEARVRLQRLYLALERPLARFLSATT
ncbi:hypothetical protein ASE35_06955 [Lysobacter sp. Root916]|uniref:5-oxoprolinase subunit C family protein n=1 Tax=Lysobacter sp. Root916 TaxID=1736606 RepID=UPI00070914D7|nr:biotin-dependent carboxyltransferase family protein [Lysobacter sp. Root916]KRD40039.1 hypothetical protein ASE35_06955 [Lysobacter sp. Root916]